MELWIRDWEPETICTPFNSLFYSLHSMRSLLSTSKPRSSSSNIQCMNHIFLRKLLFTSPCHLLFPFLKSKAVPPPPHTLVFGIPASWNHVDLPCLKVLIYILSFALHILFRRKIAKHYPSNQMLRWVTSIPQKVHYRQLVEVTKNLRWSALGSTISHPLISHVMGTPHTSNQTQLQRLDSVFCSFVPSIAPYTALDSVGHKQGIQLIFVEKIKYGSSPMSTNERRSAVCRVPPFMKRSPHHRRWHVTMKRTYLRCEYLWEHKFSQSL